MAAKHSSVSDELADSTVSEEHFVGTHYYKDVLFTGPECVDVVDATTNEKPPSLNQPVKQAIGSAEDRSDDVPHVAKRRKTETAIETRSPYSTCVFYHYSITGDMDWHSAFAVAYDDPEYTVTHDANYRTGTLTITVDRTE